MANKNKKQNTQNTSKWSKTNGEWDHLPKDIYYKILKKYNSNFSKESLDYLYDRLGDTGFDPVHVFYLLATESSFQKNSANNKSTAKGLTQITKDTFNTIFKDKGPEIYQQYLDGTRSEIDQIDDAFANIKKLDKAITTRPDHRAYGRLKVNNLMPSRRFNDPVDQIIYDGSLTPVQKSELKDRWKSMDYEDLATYYDNDFNNWQNKWGLPKFDLGGIEWNSGITEDNLDSDLYETDEDAKWWNIGGGALSGLGTGAMIGNMILPGIGGGIGAIIGGLGGAALSAWKNKKSSELEEDSRKQALVAQAKINDQQIGTNMTSKYQQDLLRLQQKESSNINLGNDFYAKFGGLIGRKRMAMGGQIVPNSSNTTVAYGRTHEQIDPKTGETGIAYNNRIEVEGGGYVNGKSYAGEVIRETPMGSQVFSDTLMVPQMKATYAEVAKNISDKKGILENKIITLDKEINAKLDNLGKIKRNKLQTGTEIRNIEKLNFKMNKTTGLVAKLEKDTSDLFHMQEQHATALGLRPVGMRMEYGGMNKVKAANGWFDRNIFTPIGDAANWVWDEALTPAGEAIGKAANWVWGKAIVPAADWTYNDVIKPSYKWMKETSTSASKWMEEHPNEMGLFANILNTAGSAAMSYGAYRNAMDKIDFERKLALPKQAKLQTILFDPTEDVSSELQEIQSTFQQGVKYIKDNTKDPAIAQSRIAQLYIQSLQSKNKLYAEKRRAEKQTRNTNITNIINTLNQNQQIAYANAMAEYQKATGLNMAEQQANAQLYQNLGLAFKDVNQSIYSYNYGKMVEQGWDRGHTNNVTFNATPPVTTAPVVMPTIPIKPTMSYYDTPEWTKGTGYYTKNGIIYKHGGLVRKR